jgi:hypothetical protein
MNNPRQHPEIYLQTILYKKNLLQHIVNNVPWYMIPTLHPNLKIIWNKTNINADINVDINSNTDFPILSSSSSNCIYYIAEIDTSGYHNLWSYLLVYSDSFSKIFNKSYLNSLVEKKNKGFSISRKMNSEYNEKFIESPYIKYYLLDCLISKNIRIIARERYIHRANKRKEELCEVLLVSQYVPKDIFKIIFIYLFKVND